MSEHDNDLASDLSVGENQKPNRKEPKQISFRVSGYEYEKLRSSAETMNMSVPNFVKKKAHGSRLVAPKFDKETRQSIDKKLSKLSSNVNHIDKYYNQQQHDATNYENLKHNIKAVRERLNDIWEK